MSDKNHKKHRTKFSEDTAEDQAEKREISSRVGRGLLSDKEALYGAPTAASGTYVGEVFDANGNVQRFIGAKKPLYITPEVLDFEFVEYLKDDKTGALAEVTSRGKPPSNEDKIVIMARTEAGRTKLKEYATPSELFAVDSGAKPMLVKDYYLEKDGLKGQMRGIRKGVIDPLGSTLSVSNSTFANYLANAIKGVKAA
jgi:hypothetical protein